LNALQFTNGFGQITRHAKVNCLAIKILREAMRWPDVADEPSSSGSTPTF
jgi:hypothetical protein